MTFFQGTKTSREQPSFEKTRLIYSTVRYGNPVWEFSPMRVDELIAWRVIVHVHVMQDAEARICSPIELSTRALAVNRTSFGIMQDCKLFSFS